MLPTFLNVDLELDSEKSLDPLARELDDKVFVLYHGPYQDMFNRLALEMSDLNNDPDYLINSFCELIEKLSPKSKAIWRGCFSRRFDIGIESGTVTKKHFQPLRLGLGTKTLKRVSALSAEVVITVYPLGMKKFKPKKPEKK